MTLTMTIFQKWIDIKLILERILKKVPHRHQTLTLGLVGVVRFSIMYYQDIIKEALLELRKDAYTDLIGRIADAPKSLLRERREEVTRKYNKLRDEGYNHVDAARLTSGAGASYDNPYISYPTFPKWERPKFVSDTGKLSQLLRRKLRNKLGLGVGDREKTAKIHRESLSQQEPMKTGGYTKRRMNYEGPVDNPMRIRWRADAPVPDWSGYLRNRGGGHA